MKIWRLLLSPPQDAFTNMALDEAIARTPNALPTFRIYYWNAPSLSIGYFQKAEAVLDALNLSGSYSAEAPPAITLVRRPTGGTAVLHNDQPSFSLVLKIRTGVEPIYHLLGKAVTKTLRTLGVDARLWEKDTACDPVQQAQGKPGRYFCTSNFAPHDVVLGGSGRACSAQWQNNQPEAERYEGQKVAGYSARRSQGVTLFQGYLHLPEPVEQAALLHGLTREVGKVMGVKLEKGNLTESEILLTKELRQKKYIKREWNYKR